MSDNTPTERYRLLRSPFNGEVWKVPPDVTEEMYDHLVNVAKFIPVTEKVKPVKDARAG